MQLIEYNPFRIIGVLAGTSSKEEHTKVKKLKMYVAAVQEIPLDYFFPVLGSQSRSLDQIEKATSKLNLNEELKQELVTKVDKLEHENKLDIFYNKRHTIL